eukprot:7389548-Prymnesium_polylepis.1
MTKDIPTYDYSLLDLCSRLNAHLSWVQYAVHVFIGSAIQSFANELDAKGWHHGILKHVHQFTNMGRQLTNLGRTILIRVRRSCPAVRFWHQIACTSALQKVRHEAAEHVIWKIGERRAW